MPFELEADQPLTALSLIPTSEVRTRELLVYRDNVETENLRLTEMIVSATATTSHTHHYNHKFSIRRDIAVPLYTLKQSTQQEFVMEVICDGTPLVFSFAKRQDVLELQRFFTGYAVKDSFLGADIYARVKGKGLGRKSEHQGVAEVQLWEWPDESQGRGLAQLSPTTTRSSESRTPTSSVAQSELSISDVVTIQTDYTTGRQAVVADLNPPPLLVLFLQESDQYTMLSFEVTHIETSPSLPIDGWVGVCGTPMDVHTVQARRKTDGLKDWNLCSLAPTNTSRRSSRKCKRLLFKFNDAAETERFDTALLQCRLRRSERTREKNVALARLSSGLHPTGLESPISSRTSSFYMPPGRQSQSFTTFPPPVMSPALDSLHRAQLNLAIPSTTPQIETVIPGHRLEMGSEREVREVHGTSMPMQELPGSSSGEWGG